MCCGRAIQQKPGSNRPRTRECAKQAAKNLCAVSGTPFPLILSPCVAGSSQDWLNICMRLAPQLNALWAKKIKHLFLVFHGCEARVPLGTVRWEYSAVCCLHLTHLKAREGSQNSSLLFCYQAPEKESLCMAAWSVLASQVCQGIH